MPRRSTVCSEENDEDFYDDWFLAKSRNKKLSASIRYPTSSTYSNISQKDRIMNNADATILCNMGTAPRRVKQVLEDSNLLIEPLKYSTASSSLELGSINPRNSSVNVHFSMNKKNRWQLPKLIEKRVEELRDEQFDAGFHLTAVMVGNSNRYHQRSQDVNYLTVTSTNPNVKSQRYSTAKRGSRPVRLNPDAIENILGNRQQNLFQWRRRRDRNAKRVVNLVKYFSRQRRLFKNGNRDRNSGIKRSNETFLVNEPERPHQRRAVVTNEPIDYTFRYSFFKPDRILATKMVNTSIFKLGYGSKFLRTHHHYRVRTRARQLMRYEIHAKRIKQNAVVRRDTQEAWAINEAIKTEVFDLESDRLFTTNQELCQISVNIDEMVRSGRTSTPIPQVGNYSPPKSRSCSSLAIDDAKPHLVFVEADDASFLKFQPKAVKPDTKPSSVNTQPVVMPTPLTRIEFQVVDIDSFCASMTTQRLSTLCELIPVFHINHETSPSKLIISLDALLSKRFDGTNNVLAQLFTSGGLATFMILNSALLSQDTKMSFNLNSWLSKHQALANVSAISLEAYMSSEVAAAGIRFSVIEELVSFVVDRVVKFIELNISCVDSASSIDSPADKPSYIKPKSHIGRLACIDKQSFNSTYLRLMIQSLERRPESKDERSLGDSFIDTDMCPICYGDIDDQNYLVGLNECGHAACVQCWLSFIHTSIHSLKTTTAAPDGTESGEVNEKSSLKFRRLSCLHYKCQTCLSLSFLSTLISPELIEKYVQFNKDIYLISNKDVIYCRNEKCNRLLLINEERLEDFTASMSGVKESSKDVVLECECGYMICKLCLKEAHFPALCSQASAYAKELEKQEKARLPVDTDESLYESEGKYCPNCDNYMEKNGGCNHMSCICGNHYCWVCLKPFSYSNHTCSSPVATVKYESWNFFTSRTRNSFYRQNLDLLMTVQRNKRLKINELYLKRKNAFSIYISAVKELNNPSSQIAEIMKLTFDEQKYQDLHPSALMGQKLKHLSTFVHQELDKTIENLRKHYHMNEYLALLFNSKRSENKYFCISNYSFKSNILQSLRKSVALADRLEDIHQNARNCKDLSRMIKLNSDSEKFSINLKHLILNSLNLYSRNGLKN